MELNGTVLISTAYNFHSPLADFVSFTIKIEPSHLLLLK